MKDRRKRRFPGYSLVFGLLLSALPLSIATAQVPVKEEIGYYTISPDLCPSGTEEELDDVTFHSIILPVELKSKGITIALPVPGKGRIHFNLGVDTVDSADMLKPEIFEDAEGTIPVKSQYESDEGYQYFYNFDTSRKETYYVKLTAPDYMGSEDLPINFSAQFYDGADRSLTEGIQAFCAVTDDIPVTYEVRAAENGMLVITADNYSKEHPPVVTLYDGNGEIGKTKVVMQESALVITYQVKAGDYQIRVTDNNDFYRIKYDLLNSKEQRETVPKTGEGKEAGIYYGLAALCFSLLIILRIKDASNTDKYYR
jgi:hypothetical protein